MSVRFFAAVAALALCGAPTVLAADTAAVVVPQFMHALPDMPGKSMKVVTVSYAPGAQSPAHRHGQAFVYAYVLQGAVRSQLEGQPAQTFTLGQSWSEAPGAHHVLTENASASEPARLLVVFVADSGASLKTDDR